MLIQSIGNLPDNLRGRSICERVIPTVCNVRNMLDRLVEVDFDYQKLKSWERRSYDAYNISKSVEKKLMASPKEEWRNIIREHILQISPSDLGASVVDIYLVAYVSSSIGVGKDVFFNFIKEHSISQAKGSAQAIWQVGKGDGVFLNILYDNGEIKDWAFMKKWINGN